MRFRLKRTSDFDYKNEWVIETKEGNDDWIILTDGIGDPASGIPSLHEFSQNEKAWFKAVKEIVKGWLLLDKLKKENK